MLLFYVIWAITNNLLSVLVSTKYAVVHIDLKRKENISVLFWRIFVWTNGVRELVGNYFWFNFQFPLKICTYKDVYYSQSFATCQWTHGRSDSQIEIVMHEQSILEFHFIFIFIFFIRIYQYTFLVMSYKTAAATNKLVKRNIKPIPIVFSSNIVTYSIWNSFFSTNSCW